VSTPDPFGDALAQRSQGADAANDDAFGDALHKRSKGVDFSTDGKKPKDSGEVTSGPLGFVNGVADLAGTSIANIPHSAAHGAVDLWRRWTGGDTSAPDPKLVQSLDVPYSENAKNVGSSIVSAATTPIAGTESAIDKNAKGIGPLKNSPVGQFVGDYVAPVVGDVASIAPVGAAASGVRNTVRAFREASAAADAAKAAEIPATAQAAANAAASSGNAGAAGAAIDTSLLKPETQAELARLHSEGKTPDPDALKRIAKAESLGVDLTAGQAKQDTAQMADEFNRRNENGNAIGNRFDAQDDALSNSLAEAHREVAPTAVANSEIQNGQAAINGIRRYDAPRVAEIDKAYSDARTLNNGNLDLDTSKFSSGVATGLKPQGIGKFLPADVQGIVRDISEMPEGRLSLDDFEGYRSQLADAQREATQAGRGNAARAIKIVRDQFEQLAPTSDAASDAKAAFDKARSLYASRANEIEANPAYKAVVEDPSYNPRKPETHEAPSDLADKFVSKYVLGGSQQGTVRLRSMLSGDQEANEAITSEALRPLRKAATEGKGFSQATYNTYLQKLNARPELVNDAKTLEKLNDIGEVGQMTRLQRRGGVFNNSGTGSLMLQRSAELANSVPGRVVLGAIPYGTEAAKAVSHVAEGSAARAAAKAAKDAIKPGAGLEP